MTVTWKSPIYPNCSPLDSDRYFFDLYNNAGLLEQEIDFFRQFGGEGQTHTVTVPVTQGPYFARFSVYRESLPNCGTPVGSPSISTQVWCSTNSSPLAQCCPPDPSILVGIKAILNAIANINIVGEKQPIDWVDGVRHSGLSGAGSFPLVGQAIGIRVEMKTLPSGVQVNPGNPTFYWDSGFITPYAAESPLRGNRLVFQTQSFQLPPFTDMIGYTLLHGCVVDIVELMPVFAVQSALN